MKQARLPERKSAERASGGGIQPGSAARWLGRLVKGAIIGGGAILPGVSGGVLAVVFGLYRPMMDLFSAPVRGLKQYWRLFLPVVIGWALGFVLLADLITVVFSASYAVATWLFIGLIAGTAPSLLREAGKEGRGWPAWMSMGICFFVMLNVLILAQTRFTAAVTPGFFWFFFCGLLWGLSLIVPGMTSSSILMSMNLFEPMTAGVAALDFGVLLPMLLGIGVVAALLSRLVNRLFQKRYKVAFHGILGVVLASTVAIIPMSYASAGELLLCLGCAGLGFLASYLLERFVSPSAAEEKLVKPPRA